MVSHQTGASRLDKSTRSKAARDQQLPGTESKYKGSKRQECQDCHTCLIIFDRVFFLIMCSLEEVAGGPAE